MDSMMFHHPNVRFCALQAKAMGLRIGFLKVNNDNELAKLEKSLARMIKSGNCEAVCCGAIESEYQKQRIDGICAHLGIPSFTPVWRTKDSMLGEVVGHFNAVFTKVAAGGFSESYLGRKFDQGFLDFCAKSSPKINPHLEGGEGETFVLDAPFFASQIKVEKSEKKKDGSAGWLEFTKARLAKK